MSFAEACDWSLFRSLLLVGLAWPICVGLEQGLRASRRPIVFLWLLATPFLFPELLIGYLFAPHTAGRPVRAEVVCALVLLIRGVPIGVIALWNSPPSSVSSAALHLRSMKLRSWQDAWELYRCYWHGPIRRVLPALGLMFLVTFQEFEAAALLGAVSWTDKLFVEYATGLSLGASVRFLVRPMVMQLLVLLLVSQPCWRREEISGTDQEHDRPVSLWAGRLAEMASLLIFLLGVVLPLGLLRREIGAGWNWLWTQPTVGRTLVTEIATAGLVALVAGLAAYCGAMLTRPPDAVKRMPPLPSPLPRGGGEGTERGRGLLRMAVLMLPGLCGGLTVSLAVLFVSSRILPDWLVMTPAAWVFALVVWLLPRSVLLQAWLRRQSDPAAMHLVELLRQSPQIRQQNVARKWWWRWQVEPQIAAVGVLCYWAYLDLTAAALLAPPGMASVMVRLYNFMHFGHSAAMSMEAAIVMFLPVMLWILMMAAARCVRWDRLG